MYSFYIKGRYEYADSYEDILDILCNEDKEYAEEEIDSLECSIDEGRNMINDLECILSDTDDLNTQRQEIFSSLDNIKERLSY